jgi:hypothetical protein
VKLLNISNVLLAVALITNVFILVILTFHWKNLSRVNKIAFILIGIFIVTLDIALFMSHAIRNIIYGFAMYFLLLSMVIVRLIGRQKSR